MGGASGSYLTIYPHGEVKPTASTISFERYTVAVGSGVLVPLCDRTTASCDYDLNVCDWPGLAVDLVVDAAVYSEK